MTVVKKVPSTDSNPPAPYQVDTITYNITNRFANTMFDACKNVQSPGTGAKALDVMCGNQSPCTPQGWLNYMGTRNPGAFQINYSYQNVTGDHVMDARTFACNDTTPEGNSACSCTDCPVVCAPPKPSPPRNPFKIFGVNGYQVLSGLLFLTMLAVIVFYFLHRQFKQQDEGKLFRR